MKQQVRLIPVALTLSVAGLFWYSYKYIPSMSSISRSISILFYVLFLVHISEVKSGEFKSLEISEEANLPLCLIKGTIESFQVFF
jgi:hypothetical protein